MIFREIVEKELNLLGIQPEEKTSYLFAYDTLGKVVMLYLDEKEGILALPYSNEEFNICPIVFPKKKMESIILKKGIFKTNLSIKMDEQSYNYLLPRWSKHCDFQKENRSSWFSILEKFL